MNWSVCPSTEVENESPVTGYLGEPVTVVVPFSRPWRAESVQQNFERQDYENKHLIVVENGEGVGYWKGPGEVLRSRVQTAGAAKNVALDELRKRHGAARHLMAVMDDDDYYGARYLAEQVRFLQRGHHLVGKNTHFVIDRRGFWLVNPLVHDCSHPWCSGATQAFNIQKVERFIEKPTGEDLQFVRDASSRGTVLHLSTPFHYLWERRGMNHAYKGDTIKRAKNWGLQLVYLGQKPNYDVVDGKAPAKGSPAPPIF